MQPWVRSRAALAALAGAALFAGCSGDSKPTTGSNNPSSEELGSLDLALNVAGYTINAVTVAITSQDLTPQVTRTRTLDVSDPNATLTATEYGLRPGSYGIALSANVVDDPATAFNESTIACAGSVANVVVRSGAITAVDNLVLVCTRDGGQVQTGGGVAIDAGVTSRTINNCPDLVESLSISPLETSVGAQIKLATALAAGATVTWSAPGGVFAADGSSYTCPAVAGAFTLTATVRRADGCQQVVAQQVKCHNNYQGSCETLPSAFAFEGSCGLRSPCHAIQNGCDWQINCRGQSFSGEGEGSGSFPFIYTNGRNCSATLADGKLSGTCTDAAGASCTFNTNSAPPATPFCEKLPSTISNITACGVTYQSCSVIQAGCTYQANCDNGAAILNGAVVDDQIQWNPSVAGKNYRCQGPITNGAVSGTCTQTGNNIPMPATCSDFSATVPVAPSSCEETLPSAGFALAGCGLDGSCFAVQRGCVWQVSCSSGVYSGTATASNAFQFTGPEGRACTASVVDGAWQGQCEGGGESCSFAPVEPVEDTSCLQLPDALLWQGCGTVSGYNCNTFQNGCNFGASCNGGQLNIYGSVRPTGITFPGIAAGWTCNADVIETGNAMHGQCTRPNADGTVSNCRDLTNQIGARLVLSWSE